MSDTENICDKCTEVTLRSLARKVEIATLTAERDVLKDQIAEMEADGKRLLTAHSIEEYHEDIGCVLWHKFPINEPPYVGDPNCSDWPGYHTHWTPLPDCNKIQHLFDAAMRGEEKG